MPTTSSIQLASEDDKEHVCQLIGEYSRADANGVPQVVLRRLDRPAQPPGRDSRAGMRRAGYRGAVHPKGAARYDRRLQILTVQQHRREAKHRSPDFARDVTFQKTAPVSKASDWRRSSSAYDWPPFRLKPHAIDQAKVQPEEGGRWTVPPNRAH